MKSNTKKQAQVKGKASAQPPQGLYGKIDGFFERNQQIFFVISMILSVLMSIFLFDVKVSLSGDDSDYLIGADNFWHHFTFPGGHGILYPILLSPFVGIFGMKLLLLKSFSAIFILLSIWLLYKSFRGKVPAVVLMPTLLLVSVCSYIFFYAGHTYSEPLFMLVQGLFIYFFSKFFLCEGEVSYQLKTDWRKYLILGALALGMTLTRTIGYGVLGVTILYFVIQRKWKDLLYMLTASVLVFGLWKVFQSIVWPASGEVYPLAGLLARDVYNPNLGMEDFPGIVKRFVENSHIYFSSCLYQFMGLIGEQPSNYLDFNSIRTILIYILYAVCLTVIIKRNKTLLFVGLYIGVMNFATFLLIQASWAQDRLIMIYYPLILLFLLGGICYLFRIKVLRKFFFIYPLLLIVIGIGTLSITKNRIGRNLPVLQQNLLGDPLYGWTPDWQNFVKGSQWAAKNLEKDAMIISRKPSISKVYTGRDFLGSFAALTVPHDVLEGLNYEGRTILVVNVGKQVMHGEPVRYIIVSNGAFTIEGAKTNGVGIYAIPNEDLEKTLQIFNNAQIGYTLDYTGFLQQCKDIDFRIYDPDMMLRHLMEARVDYLLLPQLRVDPTRKTNLYINNIHRFIWYISYKHPGRFDTVHTVGNDEPCEIVKFIK
ncbi:MAG: glycosyltransferase family 39 protein [Tannerella sp.]|jgi:hypothetical protein|nr:glycosyltransferase family 39 protein [Tannerella sp.]